MLTVKDKQIILNVNIDKDKQEQFVNEFMNLKIVSYEVGNRDYNFINYIEFKQITTSGKIIEALTYDFKIISNGEVISSNLIQEYHNNGYDIYFDIKSEYINKIIKDLVDKYSS